MRFSSRYKYSTHHSCDAQFFQSESQKESEISKQTLSYQPISMANSYTLLQNLRAGRCSNIEPMTVSELNQFVLTADPQIIEFLCTAKVTEIQLDEGWSYIGCSVCSKKLTREETSFSCVPCNETNAVAKLRYRVILSVSDATGAAAFLGFDTEMSKLTHVLASEAAQIVGIGTNAQVDVVLPRPLADLVGRTYTFQLKLTDFNFTPNHQTFTISRIFPQRELAPNPTFAEEDVEVIEPAIPQSAAERSGDKDATTSNVAEQLTVATDDL
ncbi:uncharacterized protein LOC103853519 isoform X1 [Brassica rapa]|uniref:uncharacterized protein LOC103853519 isoform X1 n=2 Tax=Brassica campestris TaxID=3711 RepID=UPI00142E6842|nr:uncharacterized protein LOC103853519 isoform X1 [Brassica rapa]